ncbi:hypothetical protein JL721_3403 [Aureococcus anophagefferens]|nr:hypothetical protein JL721_3403 [Aureococcus anophagefferens]
MAALRPSSGVAGVHEPCALDYGVSANEKARRLAPCLGRDVTDAPADGEATRRKDWNDGFFHGREQAAPRREDPEERSEAWATHARPEIAERLKIADVVALVDEACDPDLAADVAVVVLEQAVLGFGRDPACACAGFRESAFYIACVDMGHPVAKEWSADGCEHRGNDPSSPPLTKLREGEVARAAFVCAKRDECKAVAVHFFVAYLCSLPPALAHHAAHANYSKMLRLALFDKGAGGEAGVRAAAAVEALDLYVAGCRPVDLDARFLYAYAEDVAATCPAASLLSLPRVQHCDGCGLRQPGMARCSRCRHVAYCSNGCQRNAWARRHRKTCAELAKLTERADEVGYEPGLDKQVCPECDFGPTTPDLLRWHCTLTRHKRWPEIDLITYAAPERARGNE